MRFSAALTVSAGWQRSVPLGSIERQGVVVRTHLFSTLHL